MPQFPRLSHGNGGSTRHTVSSERGAGTSARSTPGDRSHSRGAEPAAETGYGSATTRVKSRRRDGPQGRHAPRGRQTETQQPRAASLPRGAQKGETVEETEPREAGPPGTGPGGRSRGRGRAYKGKQRKDRRTPAGHPHGEKSRLSLSKETSCKAGSVPFPSFFKGDEIFINTKSINERSRHNTPSCGHLIKHTR